MSLVGSLEDLGLGDILQIVSLSRKSGLLLLHSDSGDGRIVLCDGLVRGASVKGGFEDLRGLLVGGGFLSGEDYDAARAIAAERSLELGAVLAEVSSLTEERLDSLRREHVERAVMRMFTWRSGEFSFEVRDAVDAQDVELLLPTGINTQYLAMEATRLRDEVSRDEVGPPPPAGPEEEDDAPLFSGEKPEGAGAVGVRGDREAVDALALAAARRADRSVVVLADDGEAETPHAAPVGDATSAETAEIAVDGGAAAPEMIPVRVEGSGRGRAAGHVVVVDPDLGALEWFKAALEGRFERIHIFQRSELALDRIRQYLGRGILPVVVVSARTPVHSSTGATDVAGFVSRLRGLARHMPVALLCEEGREESAAHVDATLVRPRSPGANPEGWTRFEQTTARLQEEMEAVAGRSARRAARPCAPRVSSLTRLKEVSDRLRDPSTQGEVLSLVLTYASEILSRVVIFMVREEVAVGMAQRGLERAGGPGDAALQGIELPRDALPELFARVLEVGRAQTASLSGPRDRALIARLGSSVPERAYVAPIESGGCVVALLYGDNLPGQVPIGDTTALEIVLHEAGLALDRALLERALADAESG
jgi:hypothetical protein